MTTPPRLKLALAPTPILKLERLSRHLGVEMYFKRDDLTGLLESGNKVRKLEFLVGEALTEGADTLISCGTLQSNCCRAVSAVAARPGVRAAGGNPYIIPESGSNEVGALVYLECAVELAEQISHGGPRFDTVVITAFSGGSQAGLLMGKQLAGLPSEIVGVPIAFPADHVREHIAGTIDKAIRRFGFAIDVPKRIHLLDGYQGVGRAAIGEEELATLVGLARQEGVLLDPVYTVKAFGGLMDRLARDAKAFGQRVCFIHTGGLFSVFPLRERLSRLLDAQGRARA